MPLPPVVQSQEVTAIVERLIDGELHYTRTSTILHFVGTRWKMQALSGIQCYLSYYNSLSYARTQWRRDEWQWVRGTGPALKWGAPIRREFLALKVQLVVLVSAFVMMVSAVWSVSSLLFFYSRCAQCPAISKSRGHVPLLSRALWSRRHCLCGEYSPLSVSYAVHIMASPIIC